MKQLILLGIVLFALQLNAQTIEGSVFDAENGEAMPYAIVILEQNGEQVRETAADLDGFYKMTEIPEGIYNIKVDYVGYLDHVRENISIGNAQDLKLNFFIEVHNIHHHQGCSGIIVYRIPLIDLENTSSGQTLTDREIWRIP